MARVPFPHRLFLLAAAVALPLPAQSPAPVPVIRATRSTMREALVRELDGLQVQGQPDVESSGAAPQDPQAAEAAKNDPKRLQAFQQVVLDRRNSTILEQWSKPEPVPADVDPELELPEAPGATPPTAPTPPELPPAPNPGQTPSDPVEREAWEALAKAARERWEAETKDAREAFEAAQKAFAEQQQAFQKQQAEFAQKKAKIEAARLAREAEIFSRHVTLGRWDRVDEILDSFAEQPREQLYLQMLQKLNQPPKEGGNNQLQPYQEENVFGFEDILGLVRCAPDGFDVKFGAPLSMLIRRCFELGYSMDDWLAVLRRETARPEGERSLSPRDAALLLTAQGQDDKLREFLPSLDEATAENDRQAMNLLARHFVAVHRKEQRPEPLQRAWEATLAALAPGEIEAEQKAEALKRAVELAPKLRAGSGETWLEESFTTRPDRGMEILATIGAEASLGMVRRPGDTEQRKSTLELLHASVEALLEASPERAESWRDTLVLLADIWLREARHSYRYSESNSMGPVAQRDSYGNIYWVDYGGRYRSNPVNPLEPGDLLELRPDGAWRDALPDSVRPEYDKQIAELFLKVGEEAKAFPYIEALAKTDPETANQLAREFVNVWIRNHDPNSSRNRIDIYNFQYGYNTRAAGIPLTRSKQERNLRELADLVAKLRSVEGLELDTALLVRAFTASHSPAEVYRIETLEAVFGDLSDLDPKTLASMAQNMRANLATTWRVPAVQQQAGTNRKQKDIEAEVQKGYALAQAILAQAIAVHPDSWQLILARAALIHDLNNYRNELKKSSEFAATRTEALGLFAEATRRYVEGVEELKPNERTVEAFEFWFYAALGASDLASVDESTVLARHQIPEIRAALEGMPGEIGESHRAMFANSLFSRLSAVNPAVKNRYLEAGFEIVGDHPQADAARRVYQYYKDLVTEIEVVASVDGDTDVGTEPFGVMVSLRYTNQIGRESGGFEKYLQNQNNAVNAYAYYNSGRPPENYRDKFEESVRTVLDENFEVLSVTFNKENATSKADDEFGWRRMNYAYVLLKAKGPQVDRIPPLKLDLDFNDVTGYVVLPIASHVLPIDASARSGARPFSDLELTQTLDEREAKKGRLGLEIKATAEGVLPDLDALLEIDPTQFEVASVNPQPVSVARFADDEEGVLCERLWTVELRARDGVENPDAFEFGEPVVDAQSVFLRYDDADMVTASAVVSLGEDFIGDPSAWWLWLLPGIGALALMVVLLTFSGGGHEDAPSGPVLPSRLTPFSVLGLLQQVRDRGRLSEPQRAELTATIHRIEDHFFGERKGDAPDLDRIAREWIQRA